MMKHFFGSVTFFLFFVALSPAWGEDVVNQDQKIKAAQTVAESWLTLTDVNKTNETWDSASPLLQSAITKEQWQKSLQAARGPLGELKSRKLKTATFAKSMPGAPDGEYVVIQYETVFANKAAALETITPALDKDGKWKVAGYLIK